MISQDTITYALGIIALLNVVAMVWNSIKKPQVKSELNDAVFDVRFSSLEKLVTEMKLNDLHELKGLMNAHIVNQNTYEREMSDKYARLDENIKFLINKK